MSTANNQTIRPGRRNYFEVAQCPCELLPQARRDGAVFKELLSLEET